MKKADFEGELIRQEVVFSRVIGTEEAVRKTAAAFFAKANEQAIAKIVSEIMAAKKIQSRGAKAAFRVLKEYWLAKFKNENPILSKIASSIGKIGLSWKALEESNSAVVFKVGSGKNCGLLRACGFDVKKCEAFCRAHLNRGVPVPIGMESALVVKAVNPKIKWRLRKMRQNQEDFCEYAIVLDE